MSSSIIRLSTTSLLPTPVIITSPSFPAFSEVNYNAEKRACLYSGNSKGISSIFSSLPFPIYTNAAWECIAHADG